MGRPNSVASSPATRPLASAAARQRASSSVPSPLPRAVDVTNTMLTQHNDGASGKVSALPIQRPFSRWPKPWPRPNISRQSPATWFQPASSESGHSAGASLAASSTIRPASAGSILAIAHLVARRLAVARHAARQPIGGPIEHALDRYPRRSKFAQHAGGVIDPSGRRFLADEARRAPEPPRKILGQLAHLQRLGPGDVERAGWPGRARQGAQAHGVGIALPDHIDMTHAEIDRHTIAHLGCGVVAHARAHVHDLVEAHA